MDLTKVILLLLAGLATMVAMENVVQHPGSISVGDFRSDRVRRVIGGRNARLREFPWMVSLHYNGTYWCSAFLVTPKFVMTAAHCVFSGRKPLDTKLYKGYAGTINKDGPGKEITFDDIQAHSEPQSLVGQFDIALLKIAKPVKLSRSVNSICLPSEDSTYEDFSARIMGWGYTEKRSGEYSKILQTVIERVHDKLYCSNTYFKMNISLPSGKSVCAGGAQDKGICHGDSGGPLVVMNQNKPVAIGVASHGSRLGCAAKYVPSIFTDISSYTDWIKETMGDDAKEICFDKKMSIRKRRSGTVENYVQDHVYRK